MTSFSAIISSFVYYICYSYLFKFSTYSYSPAVIARYSVSKASVLTLFNIKSLVFYTKASGEGGSRLSVKADRRIFIFTCRYWEISGRAS